MAGGNAPKPPRSAPSHHRKPRWDSSSTTAQKPKPSPNTAATPQNNKGSISRPQPAKQIPRPGNPNFIPGPSSVFPFNEPPPPPSYGFHMLERRSITLADGSARSYFALPPDYENFTHIHRPFSGPGFPGQGDFGLDRPPFPAIPYFRGAEYRNVGPDNSLKRKFGEDERDVFERQRQQLFQYGNLNAAGPSSGYLGGRGDEMRAAKIMRYSEGNSSKLRHSEVDQDALKKAFFHFVKLVFENGKQRKSFLADGKQGPLPCLACARSSKDFADMHSLIMHAYNSESAVSVVDHLAFHKALCILIGWNYSMPPNNSKAYQNLSAVDAEANMDDLIIWPPTVLIHNTTTGKSKDGRMEGLGNKAMDSVLRDLGFGNGKAMSMHSREGHLGMHMVKFSGDESGHKEALRLADYFKKQKHSRKEWARLPPFTAGEDDENNPNLMKVDSKTGDKQRVFYGHLATAADLDKITFELKKKLSIVSARELPLTK